MPQIPIARKRVQAQRSSAARASTISDTKAFGGGDTQVAGQIQGILGTVDKIRIQERDKAEKTQLTELQTGETENRNKMLNDPEFGFLRTRGKQSAESYAGYSENYDKYVEKTMGGISSERVKAQFKEYTGKAKNQMRAQMDRHTGPQMQAYQQDTTLARVKSLENDAVSNYKAATVVDKDGNATSIIRQNIELQDEAIETLAKSQGLSAERTKLLKLEASTGVHSGVVNRLINDNDDKKAKEYLNKANERGEISPDQYEKMSNTLDKFGKDRDSQRMTQDIFGKGMSKKDALAEARKIDDPKLQDDTVRRLKVRYQEQADTDKTERSAFFQTRYDQISQMDNPAAFKLSADDYSKLNDTEQRKLTGLASRFSKEKKGRSDTVKTNRDTYLELLQNEDLTYDQLVSRQDELSMNDFKTFAKGIKDSKILKTARSEAAYAEDIVRTAVGVDDYNDKKSSDEAEAIRSMITEQISAFPEDKRNSPEVRKQVRDNLLKEIRVKGNWFGTSDIPAWQAKHEGRAPIRPKNLGRNYNYVDKRDSNGRMISGWESEDLGGYREVYNSQGKRIGKIVTKG